MRYDPPFHRSNGLRPVLLALLVLAVIPFIFTGTYSRHLFVLAFVFAVVASNWDLSLGFGGLFNFAHVALFAVGVYAYAILAKTLGISPWLAIPAAGLVATLAAAVLALPMLRLDGIYVILVTIAFSQLVMQIIVSQSDITGGTSGMVTLPALKVGGYSFIRDGKIGYYYTGLGLLIASTAFLHSLTRSRAGRTIVALRDNKYYAISRGISEARARLLTLTASALFTGMAGGFYASYVRVASPDAFGLGFLTLLLSILLLGGVATIWGPVVAAFFITLLAEAMAEWGPWRNIVIAALIVAIMVFYPGGLWAGLQEIREFIDARRSSLKAWLGRRQGQRERRARLGTAEQIIATAHGGIAVADTGGEKPPILMIHGNSSCKEVFLHQFAALRDDYRLIAFDLPGHGVSANADPERTYNITAYAEIAEEILDRLGVVKPVVLGWSLGGYVALELAARGLPIRGLAISGTSPLAMVPEDFAAGYVPTGHMELAGKLFFSPREARLYAEKTVGPHGSETAFLHEAVKRTDGRARAYMMTKLKVINWPRQMRVLREGRVPFAIFNGSNDPFLNHAYIAGLDYGNIWTGRPHDIPQGGHAPFFSRPDLFNAALTRFLEEACGN